MKHVQIISICMLSACATHSEDTIEEPVDVVEDILEEPVDEVAPEGNPCAATDGVEGVRFEGTIEYPDGVLGDKTNTRIHMCNGGCTMASWGEGGFCYPEGTLSPGMYAFKVVPFGYEYHATPLSFITIGEEDLILEQPILVPAYEVEEELSDGVFDAGHGLEIDVLSEGFTPYFGSEEYLSAVYIDPVESGLPINDLDVEKVVGMWYLGSFDASIDPKWSFQVKGTELPQGTRVKILNSSYADKKWLDVGSATVGTDGVLYSDVHSGIAILSTLILLKE